MKAVKMVKGVKGVSGVRGLGRLLTPFMPLTIFTAFTIFTPFPLLCQSDPVTADQPTRNASFPPSMEELAIPSGGARMNGLMYLAQGQGARPVVVLLHGYPGNERNLDLAQAIRRAGIHVLFFDYRGSWGSGGTFSFANAQADVAAAVRFLRDENLVFASRIDTARVALVGHSMGAWLALLGAAADSTIRCVGSLELGDFGRSGVAMRGDEPTARATREYADWLTEPGAPLRASAEALIDELKTNGERWDTVRHARALAGRPVLLLDNDANPDHEPLAAALRRAGARRLAATVWRTDHVFSDRRVELARAVVRWLRNGCGF